MQLNKNSWHYRLWEGTFTRFEITPGSTDLCRYCHRVFWALMGYLFLGLLCLMLVGIIGYGVFYIGLWCNTLPFLIVIGAIGIVIGLIWGYIYWINRDRSYREPTTLIGKWVQARKQQVCPIVEFSEKDD